MTLPSSFVTPGECIQTKSGHYSGPIREISDLVRHFLVEFGMQLFLHNLGTLIPNLPHAKPYFVFFLRKIQKQNGRQN